MRSRLIRSGVLLTAMALAAVPAAAQLPSNSRYANGERMPLSPIPETGEPVAPFFEGWYRNPDGSFTLSFGYFNLNGDQTLDIPHGDDNFILPQEFDGVQPTHFPASPRRDRGIFEITVPASWEESQERVVWTLTANGKTTSVPARVGYDALQLGYDPMAMGSVPPEVRFSPDGEPGTGLTGVWGEPITAKVGRPMMLTIWGEEVSERLPNDNVNTNVYLTAAWAKYRGPADEVLFAPRRMIIPDGDARGTTVVTFTAPGEYVLRARVDNFNANDSTGGDQCCWTNAYVRVTVTDGG